MLDLPSINFLEERGIDPETATRYGISTANVTSTGGASVLVFPYTRRGELVNEKFRMLPKERFWQHSGRRKLLWNADALDDPGLETGVIQPLIITEGEIDALSAIEVGFPLAVSVPDGAPPAGPRDTGEHSGSGDQDGRYSFLWHERDQLKRIKRFILATDDDEPGRRLRDELIIRLSAARCWFVEYPVGCKDLNDVLVKHGSAEVVALLNAAKPCPVQGLYKASDYPDTGPLQTFGSGFPYLDRHLRLVPGEFIVVTGIPQHGKSSFALHLLVNLARQHGWRSAMFSPEMKVVPVIRDRLLQIAYRVDGSSMLVTPEQLAWVDDTFRFIGADPTDSSADDNFDLSFIIDKATDAVMRDGIKVLLIDPFNEVEHARGKNETMTEYVSRAIRMLKRFAARYNVAVIVVAHPTKMERLKNGEVQTPSLYDISDSAAWFNKCDHGIVISRKFAENYTEVSVAKSRFDEAGTPGMVRMRFDPNTHRFETLNGDTEGGNHS